jgi:excisionase family DNA binding protein
MGKSNKSAPVPQRVLYRARTVAAMTDQSLSKVYKDIETGLLKSVRLGSSVRVPADALEIYLKGELVPESSI